MCSGLDTFLVHNIFVHESPSMCTCESDKYTAISNKIYCLKTWTAYTHEEINDFQVISEKFSNKIRGVCVRSKKILK